MIVLNQLSYKYFENTREKQKKYIIKLKKHKKTWNWEEIDLYYYHCKKRRFSLSNNINR